MTLCDTGPLVALIDRNDSWHMRSVAVLDRIGSTTFVTTWPCFTEAMYFLFHAGGLAAQEELWNLYADGIVRLHPPDPGELDRVRALMRQYADSPMDFADASLVAAAETLDIRRVFTLDRHFHAYRTPRGHFDVVP
ncbi:type II toxin-antitoxin system VapC family toxin [Longimicrobium sp.]|uniref:type II toxin-antitoxin system VapC family toxin n=1 Tax=Longimicrobium sp. TaxID=2029185 RepID=UPI002BED128A|nr:hypothetical protein [Longimicrobium sp.]HSU15371.1 hypothetical protein [Longimicrobium sp.]